MLMIGAIILNSVGKASIGKASVGLGNVQNRVDKQYVLGNGEDTGGLIVK
jgi:hypothetical protein